MTDRLHALRAAGALSAQSEQLARTLCRAAGETREALLLALGLVSHQVERGHVCLDLPALTRGELGIFADANLAPEPAQWPELADWLVALSSTPLVAEASAIDAVTPLVLDARGRLYLRRYFMRERSLSTELARRMAAPDLLIDHALLARGLARLFPGEQPDLQREAAKRALERPLCVISGGPGTGKTATVVKILALVVEQAMAAGHAGVRMRLLAPTGKAATRVVESIRKAKLALAVAPEVLAAIPDEAATIHRALSQLARAASREPSDAPPELAVDLALVDEASMVDLELMDRLLSVVPRAARVILLGDRHQLASVEAGAVLGDICGAGRAPSELSRAPVVQLTRSYRYSHASGIGALSRAINEADAAATLSILDSDAYPDVSLCEPTQQGGLGGRLLADALSGYTPSLRAATPALALALLERFRVLCAHRRGPRGVTAVNAALLRALAERGLIAQRAGQFARAPILITQNDYTNKLWNGDLGFVFELEPDAPLMAAFVGADGQLRSLGLSRLPAYESALAMSVHKSQGSEVDEVAVVLPAEASPVLTRELLYTAVTRARKRVVLHGSRALVELAVRTQIARSTGLSDALYG
jgi:exodeoxyribonuclease V alpha subunit